MRWSGALLVLALAGCTGPVDLADVDGDSAPCPGHFHVTLLVADGDEIVPYFTDPMDLDARSPVPGIHMHSDDGIIHIHPSSQTCLTTADALLAVGVEVDVGHLGVDGTAFTGPVRIEVQEWDGAWKTWSIADLDNTVPNAARVLLIVNPPPNISGLRDQVPEIPEPYRP